MLDEIFTGGRMSEKNMFLCLEAPQPFLSQVSHVALGKWMQCGIVLCKHSVAEILKQKK